MKKYKLVKTITDLNEIIRFFSDVSENDKTLNYTEKLILETKVILVAYYDTFKFYVHKENGTGVLKICVYQEEQ